MLIREAKEADVPEIVEVLRASLGETDLPLSEEIWNYKHVENPFGPSLVLLAVEEEKIIGVRAFMRWQWQDSGQRYKAFRAVDTATHPNHQGKGIFKKLTLAAIEKAAAEGNHFIFNTPNDKSRPGYLKMGWKPAGKLRVGLFPAYNSFWKTEKRTSYSVAREASKEDLRSLCENWNALRKSESKIFTPKSEEFLWWRYEKNPLQKYEVIATSGFYLAVYVKKRKNFRELRIAECIIREKNATGEVKKRISKLSSVFGAHVISFSPQTSHLAFLALKGKFGPILTFRDLNIQATEEEKFLDTENWAYSLGDLELF